MELPEDILDVSRFTFNGDFETQVEEILNRVRLSRSQVEHLQCLLDDLTKALSSSWPGCRVYPFGSIVTGLGIKTSDIDCFTEVHPHVLKAEPVPVVKAKMMLQRCPQKFTKLFAIASAKVPIIKFLHLPTGFNCDTNFSSFAGVKNSQLIAYLMALDPRALQLSIIVKYWSKVYKFTGTNLLPNYALTMMVIFYLQMVSALPTVHSLQMQIQPWFLDNWNTAFNSHSQAAIAMSNKDSLYDLLGGFFKYYATFDFDQNMLCPYLGIVLKKESFASFYNVPANFYLYKENAMRGLCPELRLDSSVCVQDPFDHSRNCTVGVSDKLLLTIKSHFELAVDAFHKNNKRSFLRALLCMSMSIVPEVNPPSRWKRPPHKMKDKHSLQAKKKKQAAKYKSQQKLINWYHNTRHLFQDRKKK